MTIEMTDEDVASRVEASTAAVLEDIRGVRDVLSVRRVFGEPFERNGVTVIPVARIGGGAGGGGGEGTAEGETGGGFGSGFGMGARPVGMYTIDAQGRVGWRPAIDASQLAKRGQVLAGIFAVCLTLVLLSRR